MATYNNSVVVKFDTAQNGNAGSSASITVYLAGTDTLADITHSGSDPTSNPMFADENGNYSFEVDDGYYDIVINEGFLSEERIENQQIAIIVPVDAITGHFDTLQDAISTPIEVGQGITTAGYYQVNDGGAAQYNVVAGGTGVDDGGSYIDMVNGNQLELIYKNDSINCEVFGVEYRSGDQGVKHSNFINYCQKNNLIAVISGVIDSEDTIYIPDGARVFYRGVTNHSITTQSTYPTNFENSAGYRLLENAGRTTFSEPSITSQISEGGRVTDSAGNTHTLADLSVPFTVGVIIEGQDVHIKGSPTVYAKYGQDYENYNDDTINSLSDDIDVGVYIRNVSRSNIYDMTVVGHFRLAGTLQCGVATSTTAQSSERNRIRNLITQGFRGLCIRSEDRGNDFDNFGISQTVYENPEITDLDHQSAMLAMDLAGTPFVESSKCLEISGDKTRAVNFLNSTIQGRDDCIAQLHDCNDIQFVLPYFESKTARSVILGDFDIPSGSLFIASPFVSGRGDTNTLQMTGMRKSSNVDFRPFWSDSVSAPNRFVSGLFNPRSCNIDNYNLTPSTAGDLPIRPPVDGKVQIMNGANEIAVQFFSSSRNASFAGDIDPELDDSKDIGSPTKRWRSGNFVDVIADNLKADGSGSLKVINNANEEICEFFESSKNVEFSGNLNPAIDNTKDIGEETDRWRWGYFYDGVVITSPDGTLWEVSVDNAGVLTSTPR